ncbi:methyltransferase domain-containing protein [Segetibacter sp.]|jgi:2-polyprenyl-3-methyl-5-hydroxy-6-metoxy-1,4-benzoquinol methylase|uniref:methyltransferase domain-containing protein n=1 Tax=Segetibacter sp. TaxID=2231182 RepID=UPI00262C4537|nr:methyltransferase domain-containing protein [Segetibacter sp.]MCW3080095.1 methyltransferase protein [Segetibacter sp.]
MNLSQRSYQKEFLDEDFLPFADIRQNMKELNFINKWLGGHGISIDAFRQLLKDKREISICEIGCGGGDNLVAISNWCRKKNIKLTVTGIDLKKECIDFAKSRADKFLDVTWITSDYKKVGFKKKPDIIFSSLFCHHFTNEELECQFKWMSENSGIGFFINDLQRNILAYYSIKLLTRLFSNSYLVKNDAPLSVARGFNRDELIAICRKANIGNTTITWKWAFRYLIIYQNDARGSL